MTKLAIIDLGTNVIKVLVGAVSEQNYTILYEQKVPILVKHEPISNTISRENQKRIIHVLVGIKNTLENDKVQVVVAKATSLFRQASNATEIISAIFSATGIQVHVISGAEEADLIYLGTCSILNLTNEEKVIVDIGGGSIECILCNKEQLLWKKSFELGIRRLVSQFSYSAPITSTQLTKLENYYKTALDSLFAAAYPYTLRELIGASGAFRTLLKLYNHYHGLSIDESISPSKNKTLSIKQFHSLYPILLTTPPHVWEKDLSIAPIFLRSIPLSAILVHLIVRTCNIEEIIIIDGPLKMGLFIREWTRLKQQNGIKPCT